MSLLDAATDDLASLINRLDLEATPCTPDVSPLGSARRTLASRNSFESPLTRAKSSRTVTGSPMRAGLRASATSSVVSLRPYAEKSASPKVAVIPAETIKQQSGNEHLVAQHISPWEDLNWNVSPIKKAKVPSPVARPTHRRTMSPPMPFDPPPVFQPLHPPKNRVPSNPKSTKSSPETKTTELRPGTPLDGSQLPQIQNSTFGERPNKVLRHDPASLEAPAPTPVFSLTHSRNRSSLDSNKLFHIPMASETKVELGLGGTMGSTSLPDIDLEEPDSDIPRELQFILTSNEEHTDTLSFTKPGQQFSGALPLSSNFYIPAQVASTVPSIPHALTETAILPVDPIPVFRVQVSRAGCPSGDSDITSDEDTKESFDFTGEIQMLNESGASNRRSFVEQLENAFRTPARIDLKYNFPGTTDAPPVPALPTDIQMPMAGPSAITDGSSTDGMGIPEPHETIQSDDEEYCHPLSLFAESPSVDIVRERPGNPLASSRNSRPSDGQLNRSFKFGGSPMSSQRSDDNLSEEVSEVPLTLSDIIPPHSHQSPSNSQSSLVDEDSSVLKSIMAQANRVLPTAPEVAVPRARVESNTSVKDLIQKFSRNLVTSHTLDQPQGRASFVGLDSFDEVRRGFEFGPNRPAFYPPVDFSGKHNKHDSVFSVASVSSFGSVIDNGAPDPFGYGHHSRPPSEDMSISMSMSVDDTFSFVYRKRRSRVDSDASSFYFRSQPSMIGPLRRGHRAHDSIISASGAPPVSLYNRSHHGHGHRRGDSSGSVSSVALSYAMHGANGGRATWAKHSRNDPSIDSITSDYSFMRLSRPGLGDKMLDSGFDHGVPLSAISGSPNQSFDSGLYDQHQDRRERIAFDSIMDTRKSMTCDSLMDDSSERFSSTYSVFFEHSKATSEGYSAQSQFRPVSIISIDSSHPAPREDDTMISVRVQTVHLECNLTPVSRCLAVGESVSFQWVPSCNSHHVHEPRRGERENDPSYRRQQSCLTQSLLSPSRRSILPRRKRYPLPSPSLSLSRLLCLSPRPSSVAKG